MSFNNKAKFNFSANTPRAEVIPPMTIRPGRPGFQREGFVQTSMDTYLNAQNESNSGPFVMRRAPPSQQTPSRAGPLRWGPRNSQSPWSGPPPPTPRTQFNSAKSSRSMTPYSRGNTQADSQLDEDSFGYQEVTQINQEIPEKSCYSPSPQIAANRFLLNSSTNQEEPSIPSYILKTKEKRILMGTVDNVIYWYKKIKNSKSSFPSIILFKVIGVLNKMINKGNMQMIFLKGDSGHILHGVFYTMDRTICQIEPGSHVMMTGRMVGSNKLQVYDVHSMDEPVEQHCVERSWYICNRSLNEDLK